jgi:hypothetical protein
MNPIILNVVQYRHNPLNSIRESYLTHFMFQLLLTLLYFKLIENHKDLRCELHLIKFL